MLGIVSGVIAGVPGRLINAWQYKKGLTDKKYGQRAASLFLPNGKVNTEEGRVIGSIVNHANISLTGIIFTYLLAATGRDKAVIKGVGVSTVAWLVIYGLTSRLKITVGSKKLRAPLYSFFDHVTLGGLCGYIAAKLGHDSLFPDKEVEEGEKLPLIGAAEDPSERDGYLH
ncbi:hypothetical protein [Dethiobacter alkaliphilus]|uniref:hypothetical protein n=1 Tax=Dethiobacter alkaliphilus TaxID=427926 RepID=UPI00222646B7|nr:hypothetical protein [Dethiobacter alkaliphilus]MCW3491301.1 hypothetical protein [Dethiobacter alkaliphilus]